ncbi:MAG: hypothetical protein Q8R87_04820, partial [Anaerolineaceae bacterium]|nr:hypothetical protein [Anaerolineaceae bacterium]
MPNRQFITDSEKEIIDLIRKYSEFSKADLSNSTTYSRSKITGCIDSLLAKKIIISNQSKEYTGGRHSKTYSLNGKLGLVVGVDIGATSIDIGI